MLFLGLRWLEFIFNVENLLSALLGVVSSWSSPSHFKFCRVLAILKENFSEEGTWLRGSQNCKTDDIDKNGARKTRKQLKQNPKL